MALLEIGQSVANTSQHVQGLARAEHVSYPTGRSKLRPTAHRPKISRDRSRLRAAPRPELVAAGRRVLGHPLLSASVTPLGTSEYDGTVEDNLGW